MTNTHSPWPLFCDDLDQAQRWISDKLRQTPYDTKLCHRALSLGLWSEVDELLNKENFNLKDATRRQLRFRIARLRGADNPYAELVPPHVQRFTDLQVDHARRMGEPAVVNVRGGIGDHLEVMSVLMDWNRKIAHPIVLQVSPQHEKALAPLIKSIPQLEMEISLELRGIQSMAIREWLCRHYGSIRYSTWSTNSCNEQEETKGTMYCWKAKGTDDPFSAYTRSVPFQLVLRYYKDIQENLEAKNLIDISDWNSYETAILQKHGIECLNPRKIGILGLIKKCSGRKVVTIDTALAHLCAGIGKKTTLLLNFMPDERWVELIQDGNCYSQHLTITRQSHFCDWKETLNTLATNKQN